MDFPYQLIDLTQTLDETIPSWNGSCGFEQSIKLDYDKDHSKEELRKKNMRLLSKLAYADEVPEAYGAQNHSVYRIHEDLSTGATQQLAAEVEFRKESVSFRVQQLKMHAGIGTHLDAPAHCDRGELTIDQLSLNDLIAPCVVIDVSDRADEEYALSVKEIETFEAVHGLIEPHSFVIIRTGWEKFWQDPKRYHNNHLFPSVSGDAAEFFLKRKIVGLGIDTLSPDKPRDGFPVHATLLGANKYIIENVANSGSLPPKGSLIMALPLKTKGGTEAPVRLVALIKN